MCAPIPRHTLRYSRHSLRSGWCGDGPLHRATSGLRLRLNPITLPEPLDVGVHDVGFGMPLGMSDQSFVAVRNNLIVLCQIRKKLRIGLVCEPIDIAGPAELFVLDHDVKARIALEWAACGRRTFVAAIDRDDDFEISEGLRLDRAQSIGDEGLVT